MAWIERHARDINPIYPLALNGTNPIPGVHLATRIVWKAREHFNIESLPYQFSSE
jgi:hypothetical protein